MRGTLLLLLSSLLSVGCQSVASVTSLPPELAEEIGLETFDLDPLRGPIAEIEVVPQQVDDVRGARIAFVIDGTPAEVRDMLLDFEAANEHRLTWCDEYEPVSRTKVDAEAVWHFKRYKILKPVVTLLYSITELPKGALSLDFRAKEPAAGVAALFGDYRVFPLGGEEPESLLVVRVFVDTGLPIKMSLEDLSEGMRNDATALREWMRVR